ncbi:hypothetical protein EDB86DRAFT_2837138 [Lactarius hatsudake]|nr:hypothetical protein EDB86DRAFT_2837138 [Lactarius hatsudake]
MLSPAASLLYHFPASNPMKKKSTYHPIPGTSAKEDDNITLPPSPLPSGGQSALGSMRVVCAPNNLNDVNAAATRVLTNTSRRMMTAELYQRTPSTCAADDDYDGGTMTATAADIPPTQPTTTMTPGRQQQ